MKILVINQASRNHGDEAAGLALIRTLYNKDYKDVTISYNGEIKNWNSKCYITYKNIKQIENKSPGRLSLKTLSILTNFPCFLTRSLSRIFPVLNSEYKQIKKADYIISAPGGPNLGKYKDRRYLWRLYCAYILKKKYALYSPSIGPFHKKDRRYTKLSIKILKNADFVSLRDNQSYKYADGLKIPYLKAIDTAFLESINGLSIPLELEKLLPEKYVVIVPHELYKWHPDFKKYNSKQFDILYKEIIETFQNNGHKIILLPQTFEDRLDDEGYFRKLGANNPNITTIPTKYSSDIQQKIIEGAEFVVGARYHTIVFAINNLTPFYCLSYEHKMINMLQILNMESSSIDMHDALNNRKIVAQKIYSHYQLKNKNEKLLHKANKHAKKLARNCFSRFELQLKKYN